MVLIIWKTYKGAQCSHIRQKKNEENPNKWWKLPNPEHLEYQGIFWKNYISPERQFYQHFTVFYFIKIHVYFLSYCIITGTYSADWETSIPVWAPKLWHPKNTFYVFFFQLYFNKKYVEVAINYFTMNLIILKWLKKQKFRQKRKTMRPKKVKVKEITVCQSVLFI